MSPILDLQRRLHEAGRIRIGVAVPTQKGRRRPQKLTTLRFTSQDQRALNRVAALYGGTVKKWADAPVGEQWEVITDTAEIRVAVPPERMALSQSLELWSGGGCVRRCDGERQANDEPCFCATLEADDTTTPRCTRHTRLSLILVDLATTGLWRLDTQGFYASEELAGAFELAQMLASATGRALLPGWLRLEQREIRRPGEPVKRFAVPVLDLEMDTAALLGPSRAAPALPAAEAPAGLTPVPAEPAPSLAGELQRVEHPEPRKPRRNAAAPIGDFDLPADPAAPAGGEWNPWARGATAAPQAPSRPPVAAGRPAAANPPSDTPAPPSAPEGAPQAPQKATAEQRKKLFAMFGERGIRDDRDERLAWINERIGRTIESTSDLTRGEISNLIDKLQQEPAAAPAIPEAETEPVGPEHAAALDDVNPAQEALVIPDYDEAQILDVTPERVAILQNLRKEAGVTDAWMRGELTRIGLEDIPAKVTKAVLMRMSQAQAHELGTALNSAIDERNQ